MHDFSFYLLQRFFHGLRMMIIYITEQRTLDDEQEKLADWSDDDVSEKKSRQDIEGALVISMTNMIL